MRRIKTYGTFIGAESGKPSLVLSQRDLRLMLAVVRAAECPVNVATMANTVHASMLTGLAHALDAFNAPAKRR